MIGCAWGLQLNATTLAQQTVIPSPIITPPSSHSSLESSVIEVPYEQTVTVQIPDAARVLSVNPGIVEATLRSPGVIVLHALAYGQTFIHIWTPSGRITRAVQVVQPVYLPTPGPRQPRTAQQIAQHLTFEYQNRYRVQHRGPSIRGSDLTTTNQFDHDLRTQMETPYGNVRGAVTFERLDHINGLSTWNAALIDGRLGPLHRFDILGGDTTVGFSDLSLPESAIRGTHIRYYDVEPYLAEAFYGQRRLGFASGLSPGLNVSNDVFFSGGRLQRIKRPWTWSLAYAGASGTDRVDIQTSQAVEANTWYWPSPWLGFGGEFGRTQDDALGYRLKSSLRGGELFNLDVTYRDISKRYENLLGPSFEEGKQGMLMLSQQQPLHAVRLRQRMDLYQDHFFPNPEEPNVLNAELELEADVDLTQSTFWNSSYGRHKLLGRLFPTDSTTWGTNLRQRLGGIPLLSNGSVFGGYEFRDTRSVNSPSSDFESHTIRLGLGAPLTDVFYWQVTEQWTFLEETLSGIRSVPREFTAGVNYSQQFRRVPLSLRSGLNFSTSANASSPNSFLANEDRLSWDGGLRYDFSPDWNIFVNSRISRRLRTTGREYELEMETGLRYLFDTGITWEPSASLSGIVFQDINGDGRQETGEQGLAHVKVTAGEKYAAMTDAGGRFYLGRVRGKQVNVAVDLSTTPQGFVPTLPSTVTVNLLAPPTMPLFFGFVAQSELRVRVFVDATMNGQYDATDVPLEGVRISLQDGTTIKTDRSGWAFFRGISPGPYQVTINLDDLASGYVPATPVTQSPTLTQGQAATVDFPIRAERSISGRVYVDRNRNGVYDDEPIVPNLPVCLDGSRQVTTKEDGRYLFKDVPAGLHRVSLNCGQRMPGYLPLNATVQTVDIPPQTIRIETIDFRLGEEAAILQDLTNDVLRERQKRQQLIDEMIRERKAKLRGRPTTRAPSQTIDVQVEVKSGRSRQEQERQLIDEMIRGRKAKQSSGKTQRSETGQDD